MEIGKIYTLKEIKKFLSKKKNTLVISDVTFLIDEIYDKYEYKIVNYLEDKYAVECEFMNLMSKTKSPIKVPILELKFISSKY